MTPDVKPLYPGIEGLAERLRGHRLPGGQYEIGAADAAAVARLTGWRSAQPHPVFSSIASLRALGVPIEQLCELCEFRISDGPMLGEFSTTFHRPLQQGIRYRTEAIIRSLERKQGSRVGVVDLLRFEVSIVDADGQSVADVRYTWLLPRRGADR